MVYRLVTQIPEIPISESWTWLTDINVAYDGSEDRTPLLRYPKRVFSGSLRFDRTEDVRRQLALMTKGYKDEFAFPLFQYQTKLKAKALAGENVVLVNAKRSDFRVGAGAFIIEGDKFEQLVVEDFNEFSVEFTTNLANTYTARAIVCPLVVVVTNTSATVTRVNPDHSGSASFNYAERLPTIPFLSPLNTAVVATFDGLPLLPYLPRGNEFDSVVSTGSVVVAYDAIVDLISPWRFAKWGHNLSFKVSHLGASQDFAWWQAFAEVIQGSANPFLMATGRADLEVVTPANGGGNAVTVEGDLYTQHYWNNDAFARIFIDSDAGRHYAKVTGISAVAGNDRLTFAPALPAGPMWASNQKVGFLLKLRNDNDRINWQHEGLNSEVTMAVRTVS